MKPTQIESKMRGPTSSLASIDETVSKFIAKNLIPADQRIVAINLGKLAAALTPENHLDGAKRIVLEAGLEGVWKKRKRFFRLPAEDAPVSSGEGSYSANPANFLSLAHAAGRLLSGSRDKNLQNKGEERAVRMLLQGTTFMPAYIPETQAERSLKGVLEEYAARLKEAIEQRTRITELWQALESTPISLEVSQEPLLPSVYGPSATFPKQLLEPISRDPIAYGQLQPSTYYGNDRWSEPVVIFGYILLTYEIHALIIPTDDVEIFSSLMGEFDSSTEDDNKWLASIGFDVEAQKFHDGEVGRNQSALDPVTIGYIHKVGLGVKKGVDGSVEIELQIWPAFREMHVDTDFLVSTEANLGGQYSMFGPMVKYFEKYVGKSESIILPRQVSVGPIFDYERGDEDAYEAWSMDYAGNFYLAEGIAYSRGVQSKVLLSRDSFDRDYWSEEEDYEEYQQILANGGWIESPTSAKLLLGSDNVIFIPVIENAEAKAGAAREGSIAASLLENAISAQPDQRITQQLIEKVALTAEVGLTFCEALLERSRAALKNI